MTKPVIDKTKTWAQLMAESVDDGTMSDLFEAEKVDRRPIRASMTTHWDGKLYKDRVDAFLKALWDRSWDGVMDTLEVGSPSSRPGVAAFGGRVDVDGDLLLTGSSPTLQIGAASGNPNLYMQADANADCEVRLVEGANIAQNGLSVRYDGVNNEGYIGGISSVGVFQKSIAIPRDTPGVSIYGNLTLDSAFPTLIVGDGTGNAPRMRVDSAAGTSSIPGYTLYTAGTHQWTFGQDSVGNAIISRFDSGGNFVDSPFLITRGAGDLELANRLGVSGEGSNDRWIQSGSGSPEGSVTAGVGSLFLRIDGGASTTMYVKESGTGNTGWVAK